MKVLLISIHHPELVRGGAQQVCYELFQGLQAHPDIEPTMLAAVDPSYPALFKSGARITGFDGREGEFLFLSQNYDHLWGKANNALLIESFVEFLELIQPEVVHFHHYMLFGIDLLTLTRRVLPNASIIFTFHEFLAICTAKGHMVRTTDGSLCTYASDVRCHQCFPDRAPEHFFMREMWMKRHLSVADFYTTPTEFMIELYAKWGLPREKLVHITNGQRDYNAVAKPETPRSTRNRFGFFGQLVDAKGIHVLLEAVTLLRADGFSDFMVELNGDNLRYATDDRRREFEEFMAEEKLRPAGERNVVFNGSYHVDQLASRMRRVDWVIVPSVWWEIFCLVISEAWMFGRPVIVSNVGGPAERVRDEVDGLHFEMGDARALAEAMLRACTEEGLWEKLHLGIDAPPSRERMVHETIALYDRSRGKYVPASSALERKTAVPRRGGFPGGEARPRAVSRPRTL